MIFDKLQANHPSTVMDCSRTLSIKHNNNRKVWKKNTDDSVVQCALCVVSLLKYFADRASFSCSHCVKLMISIGIRSFDRLMEREIERENEHIGLLKLNNSSNSSQWFAISVIFHAFKSFHAIREIDALNIINCSIECHNSLIEWKIRLNECFLILILETIVIVTNV